ncbi:acetylxylan esterase [Gemmatimonadota bacterium]
MPGILSGALKQAVAILLLAVSGSAALTVDDLRVFDVPADTMMRAYLTAKVERQFAGRDSLLAGMVNAEQWKIHADSIRAKFRRWTGPFPQRNPLDAKVTGVLEADGYRVEKLFFQSRPNFYVSANLYVPSRGEAPFPAVLYAVGHSIAGKAVDYTQPFCIALARRGIAVLAIDALGQGERRQEEYFVYGGSPGSVHQTVGFQAFLAGTHLFNLMIWDAVRAIDYLVSREDIDPQRIGITGTSGGGMTSTYILPFENRIAAAVPACNPNTWLARVRANLATDHEQVFFGAFNELVDPRGDPLLCLAPRPLLINATTRDNLNPPEGVWALDRWLYKAWAAMGAPEKLHTSMVDAAHDYNRDQREVSYAWFGRWLGDGVPECLSEGAVTIKEESSLFSTPTGSVYDLPGSRYPHSIVLEYFQRHRANWEGDLPLERLRSEVSRQIREVTGISQDPAIPAVEQVDVRVVDGIKLTRVVLNPEDGITLPAVLLESHGVSPADVTVWLDDNGKKALATDSVMLRKVADGSTCLLAVDLRGQGETAPALESKFWDFLAGDPPPSQKIRDILSTLAWVRAEFPDRKIHLRARGVSALWAAMASVLDGGVASLHLTGAPVDFADMVETRLPGYNNELILPGILTRLDMQQVYMALCPVPVVLSGPLRADRSPASNSFLQKRYHPVSDYYKKNGNPDGWTVRTE